MLWKGAQPPPEMGVKMETITKSFQTKNGLVEGVQVKWAGFSILLVTGAKGFLACGVFDLEAIEKFGVAAAIRKVL